jgi:hypothetical protein
MSAIAYDLTGVDFYYPVAGAGGGAKTAPHPATSATGLRSIARHRSEHRRDDCVSITACKIWERLVTISDGELPTDSTVPWERAPHNCARYGGFVAMTGGPDARCLPWHQQSVSAHVALPMHSSEPPALPPTNTWFADASITRSTSFLMIAFR